MTKPEIAAIYFPSWHTDPRRDRFLGEGFTEWDLIKQTRPRFEGHRQPLVPERGYRDESDPEVMKDIVDMASSAGLSAFLWDWYWYDDDDFLNTPLDTAFLQLHEPGVSFALMWANHTWVDVFPARTNTTPQTWWKGEVDRTSFDRMIKIVIDRYLNHPAAWRPNGETWFTIFSLGTLVDGLGGLAETKDALSFFRHTAAASGIDTLHINVLVDFQRFSPSEIAELGINSIGNYGWADDMPMDRGPQIDYREWRIDAEAKRLTNAQKQQLPFIPTVSMGWDSTPRVHPDDELILSKWPHLPVIVNNTPAEFGIAVTNAIDFAKRSSADIPVLINAWNEWTEGAYLEPEVRTGDGYLRALRSAIDESINL